MRFCCSVCYKFAEMERPLRIETDDKVRYFCSFECIKKYIEDRSAEIEKILQGEPPVRSGSQIRPNKLGRT